MSGTEIYLLVIVLCIWRIAWCLSGIDKRLIRLEKEWNEEIGLLSEAKAEREGT